MYVCVEGGAGDVLRRSVEKVRGRKGEEREDRRDWSG